MEIEISNLLEDNNIKFEEQKKFDWLKNKKKLSLDFYLPKYNIAIECQGEQHFVKTRFISESDEKLTYRKKLDKLKKELCEKHGIKILYYSNVYKDSEIINDKNKLIDEINSCNNSFRG